MPTFVYGQTSGGAGTSTDALAGTAVRKAGRKGVVRAVCSSTLTTTTFLLKGRQSGIEIVPNGSKANIIGPITAMVLDAQGMIYAGQVMPDEDLELTVVRAGTETVLVAVQTE